MKLCFSFMTSKICFTAGSLLKVGLVILLKHKHHEPDKQDTFFIIRMTRDKPLVAIKRGKVDL